MQKKNWSDCGPDVVPLGGAQSFYRHPCKMTFDSRVDIKMREPTPTLYGEPIARPRMIARPGQRTVLLEFRNSSDAGNAFCVLEQLLRP